MSIIFIVLPLALLVVGAALWAYVWAVRRGQFDDLDTPAVRMLHDDDAPRPRRRPDEAGVTPRSRTDPPGSGSAV